MGGTCGSNLYILSSAVSWKEVLMYKVHAYYQMVFCVKFRAYLVFLKIYICHMLRKD
jgi:hypothetical protein